MDTNSLTPEQMGQLLEFGRAMAGGVMVVGVWNYLEKKFPRLAALAPTVKRTITWITAALTAIGIHSVSTWTAASGGQLIFTVPSLSGLLHGLWDWARNVALQEWAHRSTK